VVKQWVHLCDSLLKTYRFNCYTRMDCFPWLPVFTLRDLTLTGKTFASTSEVWTSAVLGQLKLRY